jgi:hypothetical protein
MGAIRPKVMAVSVAFASRRENLMKTDDPRLEENRKKLVEHTQKINELKVTVIKSHLILEQFINEFLDASGKKHAGLKFAEKAKLCQELNPAGIDPPIWTIVTAANTLRNKVAHTLDQAQIQPQMDQLRAAYLAALTPTQAKEVETLDDVSIASSACEHCGSYLVVATDAAQARKKT